LAPISCCQAKIAQSGSAVHLLLPKFTRCGCTWSNAQRGPQSHPTCVRQGCLLVDTRHGRVWSGGKGLTLPPQSAKTKTCWRAKKARAGVVRPVRSKGAAQEHADQKAPKCCMPGQLRADALVGKLSSSVHLAQPASHPSKLFLALAQAEAFWSTCSAGQTAQSYVSQRSTDCAAEELSRQELAAAQVCPGPAGKQKCATIHC